MNENDLTRLIIGCAIEVHKELGPGLVESIYEEALCYELTQAGLRFRRQEKVPIHYKDVILASPLRLDLTIEEKVIVDNKSKKEVTEIDKQSLLSYLRLRDMHLGLLINFNVLRLVDGVHRVINGFPKESS
ncbi:MAG: GxxExxY protein [Verrucomicrobia bacterium]|nr:GxxExxY protein [Verrucomicrobiota bacterium]